MRVAILEDDPDHARVMQKAISESGHDCHVFNDGRIIQRDVQRGSYDMFVLDWYVPNIDGLDIVRWVRRNLNKRVPVLFVTVRGDESDVVEALECGADDYMIKPIRASELKARVNALLRRAYRATPVIASNEYGPYAFEFHRKEVRLRGELVALKPKEYQLAVFLFQNVGRLLSKEQIMVELWGTNAIDSRTVTTHMSQLRRKLDLRAENGFRVSPVYSLGYRLERIDA
jgi:DNA-binding response OmpR family regulator